LVVEVHPRVKEEVAAVLGFLVVVVVDKALLANLLEVLVVVEGMAWVEEEVVGIYQGYNGNCMNMEHQEGMTPQL